MKKWNDYTEKDFTFVICAYKECPYLEECVQSLIAQTLEGRILISTSTPNEHITGIADKYGIEVRINPNGGQIRDYNFALKQADTGLVMLMHQDEVLSDRFLESVLYALNHSRRPIIAFTDYIEMHDDKVDDRQSTMIRIKKKMLIPAKWKWLMGTKFGKKLIVCLGDPITHPTVVCVADEMPEVIFREDYRACMDWDLWQRLSCQQGSFVYVDEILLQHRMNDDNQTAVLLNESTTRYDEELSILCRFWPRFIARFIMHFYSKAYRYY